jgi:hypothetical protein
MTSAGTERMHSVETQMMPRPENRRYTAVGLSDSMRLTCYVALTFESEMRATQKWNAYEQRGVLSGYPLQGGVPPARVIDFQLSAFCV